MELTKIKGIGRSTANALKDEGIFSIEELAQASASDSIEQKWIDSALSLISNEEAEEKEQVVEKKIDEPAEKVVTFTFELGFFKGKSAKYKINSPSVVLSSGLLLHGGLISFEEVNTEGDQQKFKLFYSSEWSSAQMPKADYMDMKVSIGKVEYERESEYSFVSGSVGGSSTNISSNGSVSGGCTTCDNG